jgi:hypothetical protein
MAVKKKAKKSEKAKKSKKKAKKDDEEEKEPRVTRKSVIIDNIKAAGKKGITKQELGEVIDEQFYGGKKGKSRMRINNTIKELEEADNVEVEDGNVTWTG